MDYEAELQRIAAKVEDGQSLYALAASSAFVNDPENFGKLLRETDFPDEYANMIDEDPPREHWEALTGHVAFFALCADVRERLCESQTHQTCHRRQI